MSNQAVGSVYQSIIEEVINSSRVDFEESGVDDSVLEELRKGWQQKLSQLDVARFPWDPKPDPPQPAQSAPAAPAASSQSHPQAQFTPELSLPNVGTADGAPANGPNALAPQPGYNGMENKNSVAANRAAQQLQLQYGMRAAGSINAIQDRMGQQQPQPQAQQAPGQPMGQETGDPAGPQQTADAANHISNGQTDGAGDEDGLEGVLLQRGVGGNLHELGRVEIDRMLHEQMAIKAKAMEGGGLMVPLKEATGRSAKVAKQRGKGKGVAAFDGGDDDDDDDVDDEDAINSDLDDPEEDRDDDEVDDEGLGHIMLCMYDKVQRVKNKWKCTLKDGVLTVNGKEYVFHKATGEYEW
ncbi:transcription factor IIA, alpha/beta subunit domain-containing protein [Hirsutella rhossiliensis]|uniref:Transcription initiation factor IIA large subunit n=1 Tax=Hirsutella rhossiliensis TaxID=111463 RepID=A0A9P8SHR6_9HYPO|nr:transcription factor IIA, alpha/beta subunit domain-containing protein [Hirsutella rhossiliensis]KAH0962434.1 transcription factor IIA, alpha/beta subunit domain-containing protein [Hirsutella rhossiliensis]